MFGEKRSKKKSPKRTTKYKNIKIKIFKNLSQRIKFWKKMYSCLGPIGIAIPVMNTNVFVVTILMNVLGCLILFK